MNITEHQINIFYRTLSIFTSAIFFANIPLLLFLIYMGHHSFFSYDFFTDGVFGIRVFFLLTALFIVTLSMGIFWFILPIVGHKKGKKIEKWPFVGIILVNIFIASLMGLAIYQIGWSPTWIYLFLLMLVVATHISMLVHGVGKEQFASLLAMVVLIVILSMFNREEAADTLSIALRSFGVGGGAEITLHASYPQEKEVKGSLLLLSPRHVYLNINKTHGVSILERSRFDVIVIDNSVRHIKN